MRNVSILVRLRVLVTVIMGLVASDACANLSISLPWVRAAADGRSAEAYLQITSTEGATLVGANSFAAAIVTLRTPGKPGKSLKEIALPPGVGIELVPAGYRIRLDRLTRRLKLGEHVPITLIIRSRGGTLQETLVNAEVRLHSVMEDELRPHRH